MRSYIEVDLDSYVLKIELNCEVLKVDSEVFVELDIEFLNLEIIIPFCRLFFSISTLSLFL